MRNGFLNFNFRTNGSSDFSALKLIAVFCFVFQLSCESEGREPQNPLPPIDEINPPDQVDPPSNGDDRAGCYFESGFPYNDCNRLNSLSEVHSISSNYSYEDPAESGRFNPVEEIQYQAPQFFIDLSGVPEGLMVSRNFSLFEFVHSRKGRFALFSKKVIALLQDARDRLGRPLIVNSGYRSPGYNSGISGSSKWSRHMYGDAVDLSAPSTKERSRVQRECEREDASLVILYQTHVHCDWRMHSLDSDFYFDGRQDENDAEVIKPIDPIQARFIELPTTAAGWRLGVESKVVADDHEGELWVEWTITSPSGKETRMLGQSELSYQPTEFGEHRIHVLIGGLKGVEAVRVW